MLKESGPADASMSGLAYEGILDLILSQQLRGGTVVQERVLAKRLRISRTPVREAINRLEGQDLVRRASPRVLIVNTITVQDVFDILSVRQLLEADAVEQTVRRKSLTDVDELIDEVQAIKRRSGVTADDHRQLDDRVHVSIARASGNETLANIVLGLRRKTAMFDMKRIPERFTHSCNEHLKILKAIAAGDAVKARREMVGHLGNVRSAILAHLDPARAGG